MLHLLILVLLRWFYSFCNNFPIKIILNFWMDLFCNRFGRRFGLITYLLLLLDIVFHIMICNLLMGLVFYNIFMFFIRNLLIQAQFFLLANTLYLFLTLFDHFSQLRFRIRYQFLVLFGAIYLVWGNYWLGGSYMWDN